MTHDMTSPKIFRHALRLRQALVALDLRLKLIVGQLPGALQLALGQHGRRSLDQLPSPRPKIRRLVFWHLPLVALIAATPAAALDMRDYWPSLASNKQLVIQTQASQNGSTWMGLTHRYVNRGLVRNLPVMRLEDHLNGSMVDAWELRNDGTQMLEVADWFGTQHKVYTVGKEFTWGGVVNVGDVITRTIHVDVAASVGETTGPHNWATEELTIEALHSTLTLPNGLAFSNVVQVKMFQSFCITYACGWPSGQATWITRHWFAPGQGIIQTEYLMVNSATVSPQRLDYATHVVTTWTTP